MKTFSNYYYFLYLEFACIELYIKSQLRSTVKSRHTYNYNYSTMQKKKRKKIENVFSDPATYQETIKHPRLNIA